MKDLLFKRLANLLTVKSLVTLMLTIVFAVMTCQHNLEQNFFGIYMTVIGFYFGTQAAKNGGGDQ